MTIEEKSLTEITHEAFGLLAKHLGVANTVRFINQFSTGHGNYTEERKELFKDLTMEQYEEALQQIKQKYGANK